MAFARAQDERGSHRQRLWRQVVYLGRYAHQPGEWLLGLPSSDLRALLEETSALVGQESAAATRGDLDE